MKEIVLASASPRRCELLKQLGIDFRIIEPDIVEDFDSGLSAGENVQRLSLYKALSVAKKIEGNALVIGADTLVFKDGLIGKPADEKQAFEMLKLLQGSWHEVFTGVTVVDSSDLKSLGGYERTRVKMRELPERVIKSYIATGEPLDKAGAYGIQGIGSLLVERIDGCYFNVVGLPIVLLSRILEQFGFNLGSLVWLEEGNFASTRSGSD